MGIKNKLLIIFIIVLVVVYFGCSILHVTEHRLGKIEGRVIDYDGNFIENAKIELNQRDVIDDSQIPDIYEGGIFEYNNLKHGRYYLTIFADGFVPVEVPVQVKNDSVYTVIATLNKPFVKKPYIRAKKETGFGRIAGYVFDASTGEGLPNVALLLIGTDFGAISDSSGKYVAYNLPPGLYMLRAMLVGYAFVNVPDLNVKSDTILQLDLYMSTAGVVSFDVP